MSDERDEIRSRADIVELVGRRVALKRSGKNWKGLCPFHDDKNPSFYVTPQTGRYKCWSCGEGGDVFNWVMKTQNVEFREALTMLADQVGVKLTDRTGPSKETRTGMKAAMEEAQTFFRDQFSRSQTAKSYCDRRGLGSDVQDYWELGYAPDVGEALATHLKRKGFSLTECQDLFLVDQDASGGFYARFRARLMFPIHDEKGDLVAFGGRLLGDGHPKYINSGDTPLYRKSRVLYGMHRAKDNILSQRVAVLVEGYLDVIACHRAGVTNAVASLGTALSEEAAKLLKRWCDGVVILYDSDAAGQKAADRAIEVLGAEGLKIRVALMPEGEDPDTLLTRDGPGAVQKAVAGGLTPMEYRLQALERRLGPDQEEFWTEAVLLLAAASNEMELDLHIVRLASQYPGVRDQVAAQKALRRQVMTHRKAPGRPQSFRPTVATPKMELSALTPAELAVFRATLEEEYRFVVWAIFAEPELFETEKGAELAGALTAAFPEGPPAGTPVTWLGRLESAETQQFLSDLLFDPRVGKLSKEFLQDTLALLRHKKESRRVQSLKGDEMDDARRTQILDALRKLKPDSRDLSH